MSGGVVGRAAAGVLLRVPKKQGFALLRLRKVAGRSLRKRGPCPRSRAALPTPSWPKLPREDEAETRRGVPESEHGGGLKGLEGA
jgi:hypothetical protein